MASAARTREQKKRARRAELRRVAIAMFRERGFDSTTTGDIARAAGVSRGTVFNYFPYKEAILLEHAALELEPLERHRSAESTDDALRGITDDLARFAESGRGLVLPLAYELLNPDPERSRVAFALMPLPRVLRDVLARGQERGRVRPDASPERLARTVANAMFLTILQWAAYRAERPLRSELETTLRLTLEGIAAQRRPVERASGADEEPGARARGQ